MDLRDIRPDLRERLRIAEERVSALSDAFNVRITALQEEYGAKMTDAREEVDSLLNLLALEDRRLGAETSAAKPGPPATPLAEFLVNLIHARSPRTKEELRHLAIKAGYFADGEGSGRATHVTLLNIVRGGRIRDLGDGTYGPVLPGAKHPTTTRDGVPKGEVAER